MVLFSGDYVISRIRPAGETHRDTDQVFVGVVYGRPQVQMWFLRESGVADLAQLLACFYVVTCQYPDTAKLQVH